MKEQKISAAIWKNVFPYSRSISISGRKLLKFLMRHSLSQKAQESGRRWINCYRSFLQRIHELEKNLPWFRKVNMKNYWVLV